MRAWAAPPWAWMWTSALLACAPSPGGQLSESPAAAAPGPVQTTSFQEAQASGEATLAFLFVPAGGFAAVGVTGLPEGVTAGLLRDFAEWVTATHGIRLEVEWLEETRWADFYGFVRDSHGGVLGVGNVTITEARRGELDFSPPYLQNIAVLVTHTDIPELPSMEAVGEAFRGLTALPYPGTLHETRLLALGAAHLPDMELRPVASNDELVSLLASGEGYFGYIDIYNYHRAKEAGLPLRRHPVGDDAAETFGVILPRGSDWTPVLEDFFQRDGGYVNGPRYRALMERHLGLELAGLLLASP